jgi:hypothetical protein
MIPQKIKDILFFICILPLFIQVFLIEITSLFQERPGPIAAGGTTFQTKQLTYTNTTLSKTINTHTVQQKHVTLKTRKSQLKTAVLSFGTVRSK